MQSRIVNEITLYSYYLSSASWRVRSALALKSIPYNYEGVHLLNGTQHSEDYLAINPMHQVPSLRIKFTSSSGEEVHDITQSLAIMDLLEDLYPEKPSIYPTSDPIVRAKIRAIAETISGGIQPFQNLETLTKIHEALGRDSLSADERQTFARYWLKKKMANLELMVAKTAGVYCVGDQVSVADICLVPQMFNARERFQLDMDKYPTLKAIDERLQTLDVFKVSHPKACIDNPSNQ